MTGKSSIALSVDMEKTVCGYQIKRMPLGAYVRALHTLGNLPGELMAVCFPGLSVAEIVKAITSADARLVQSVLTRGLAVAPEYLSAVLAGLLGVPEDKLLEDPAIGLDGLLEMVNVWIDLNGLAGFMKAAQAMTARVRSMKPAATKDGSSA